MEHMPLEWINEVPVVTRMWSISIVVFSGLEHAGFVKKLDLYYSVNTVFHNHEFHRLITSFLYFGELSIDLFLSLYFIVRHSRSIEEGFTKKRDFIWFLFVICTMLLLYSTFVSNLFLLGSYLNDVLLFLWSRQYSGLQVSFLGYITFQAIYLPFFYLALESLLEQEGSRDSFNRYIVGIIVGHLYNFLNESFPKLHNGTNLVQPIWYWFKQDEEIVEEIEEESLDEPVDEPVEASQEEHLGESQEEPVGESVEESGEKTVEEPVDELIEEPTDTLIETTDE